MRERYRDPRGEHLAAQVREFLGVPVERIRTRDVYHLKADLAPDELSRVVAELADPVLQEGAIDRLEGGSAAWTIAVALKPGVADPVGKSARVAVEDMLGRRLGEEAAVFTSTLYLLDGVDAAQTRRIAYELLANPVIHDIAVESFAEWSARPPDRSVPEIAGRHRPPVETAALPETDAELERMSRERLLALSRDEMRVVRDHFRAAGDDPRRRRAGLGSSPTDVELECLAQTWSEHCKHKIFNATIRYREGEGEPETIVSLFDSYVRRVTEEIDAELARNGGSWLVSVFHDNAGVVTFDERVHLVYKVETHNSPSALDPYGGAITGIVGVNRDPFGTGRGADLLVNVWGYCFASPFWDRELPEGLLHPKRIRDGVHRGVIDGGNQSGIPYGRGWELFDPRYLGKPLVFCGTVGALPVEIDGSPGERKRARPGDAVVMVGGRIGADGIHGATFSSAALDESSPSQAVQIGDPITQKMMFDFLLEAREGGLYDAITDNGAGGLSSSVGEMAESCGGARIDLARAPLKYAGLAPWEIFLSEAQERMTLAVPPEKLDLFLELAGRREVEATVLGEFTSDGYLEVLYDEETVGLLPMEFLHHGVPEMRLEARFDPPRFAEPAMRPERRCGRTLLDMMGRLNLASGERKARHYDHEVKGLTVVKPLVGVARDVPAEATVFLARHGSPRGLVLSEGVNPYLSDLDGDAMAATAVDEAVRRQLCAGARLDRIAALDNFCWPDPVQSAATPDGELKLAQLVRACRGLYRVCRAYGVPLISGKDSMKNDSLLGGVKISVPPTLLVSALGQIDDVQRAVTLEPKRAGDLVYLVGTTGEHTGGSEYFRYLGDREGLAGEPGGPPPYVGRRPPEVDVQAFLPLYRAVHDAIGAGLVRSAATPGKGGLAAALARCVLAGGLGMELDLSEAPGVLGLATDVALFSESNGRFVLTVEPDAAPELERRLGGRPFRRAGAVTEEPWLRVHRAGERVLDVGVEELRARFHEGLAHA